MHFPPTWCPFFYFLLVLSRDWMQWEGIFCSRVVNYKKFHLVKWVELKRARKMRYRDKKFKEANLEVDDEVAMEVTSSEDMLWKMFFFRMVKLYSSAMRICWQPNKKYKSSSHDYKCELVKHGICTSEGIWKTEIWRVFFISSSVFFTHSTLMVPSSTPHDSGLVKMEESSIDSQCSLDDYIDFLLSGLTFSLFDTCPYDLIMSS